MYFVYFCSTDFSENTNSIDAMSSFSTDRGVDCSSTSIQSYSGLEKVTSLGKFNIKYIKILVDISVTDL